MKKTTEDLRIIHRGVVQLHNGESAKPGEAATVINMREREDAFEVVGNPIQLAQLTPGDRVLVVDDDRTLVLRGNNVMWNGNVVFTSSATVITAHKVGTLLVVVTSAGNEVFRRTLSGYEHLDPASAIPQLHITAVEQSSVSTTIGSFEFNTPYSTWQAPLASADVDALARLVGNAVSIMRRNASSQGRFTGVLLARYVVRLWDDSYLWMSQPVMVGHTTISSSYRSTTNVTISNNKFTGTEAFDLSMSSYRLGITMASGIPSEWRHLVKAIDVLVSTEAGIVDLNSGLDYRCVVSTSSGTRRYLLEVGPKPRSASAIMQTVLNGDWHVAASTSALDGSGFIAVNTALSSQQVIAGLRCDVIAAQLLASKRVGREECAQVIQNSALNPVTKVSMQHNGRLYQAPEALTLENPWHVLPWLDGSLTAGAVTATVQVTLSTSDGDIVVTKSGLCNCSAAALNPMVSFPDTRATHIAIAVGNKVWESDLAPLEGTGMAAYINPALHTNTMTTGTLPGASNSHATLAANGIVLVSAVGNPFVTQWQASVSGSRILALGAACRPIYSGGFGRYPIYIFTTQGIMALPQSTSGKYGESRLITEVVLAHNSTPVSGGDALWFVSQYGILCSISGSTLKRWLNIPTESSELVSQMAWNDRERELWIAGDDGAVQILMPSGRTYLRNINVVSLYSDAEHALAVTDDGALLDLTTEQAAMQQVSYLSQPFELDSHMLKKVKKIVWNIFTKSEHGTPTMTLTLRGERGGSCHGYIINQVQATGIVAAQLARPIIFMSSRILRLQVEATTSTGTLLQPTIITT